jgi:hypothetical protein
MAVCASQVDEVNDAIALGSLSSVSCCEITLGCCYASGDRKHVCFTEHIVNQSTNQSIIRLRSSQLVCQSKLGNVCVIGNFLNDDILIYELTEVSSNSFLMSFSGRNCER